MMSLKASNMKILHKWSVQKPNYGGYTKYSRIEWAIYKRSDYRTKQNQKVYVKDDPALQNYWCRREN
jgi:hypothetical protein